MLPSSIIGTMRTSSPRATLSPSLMPLVVVAAQSMIASNGTMLETGIECASTGAATSVVPKPIIPRIT
jgi:hypothetical protein